MGNRAPAFYGKKINFWSRSQASSFSPFGCGIHDSSISRHLPFFIGSFRGISHNFAGKRQIAFIARYSLGDDFISWVCCEKVSKRKQKNSRLNFAKVFLEPMVGLEPTTYGLRYRCSTNWATSAPGDRRAGVPTELSRQDQLPPCLSAMSSRSGLGALNGEAEWRVVTQRVKLLWRGAGYQNRTGAPCLGSKCTAIILIPPIATEGGGS